MRSLKILLLILGVITALSLIFAGPIPVFLQWYNPHMWLGQSAWGIENFFYWQIFTYILVPPLESEASFGFLINTFFTLYLLWTVGSSLIFQKGIKTFWMLFLGGGAIGGLMTALTLHFSHAQGLLAGWTPALYSLLMGWMLLNPRARVLVFLAIPMQVKWVVVGAAAITLYLDLTNGHYLQFVASFSSVLFGYLYAIIAWETHSPFHGLYKLEKFLHRFKGKKSFEFEVDEQYERYQRSR